MMLPSHLSDPVGGHRAGSVEGASDSRVTATGGGLVEGAVARETARAMASARLAAGFLIFLVGRVRVIEALAVLSGFLVLTTAIPGAATDLVPFPLWTTTTPIDPRCGRWADALDEVTAAEPMMATPWSQAGRLDQHVEGVRGPGGQVPDVEQVTLPDPADVAVGPRRGHAGQVVGEGGAAVAHAHARAREAGDRGRRGVGDGGPPAAVGPRGDLVLEGRGGGGHLEGGGGGRRVHRGRAEGGDPVGGVQVIVSVVGVPWITKVAMALMAPGTKSTRPVPGPVCQVTGL